jgi:hypothetical protein
MEQEKILPIKISYERIYNDKLNLQNKSFLGPEITGVVFSDSGLVSEEELITDKHKKRI